MANLCRQSHDGIARPLADADDARIGITAEDRVVFGKGDLFRSVLHRLPVRVVRAALNIIDAIATQLKGHPQLHEWL